MQDLNNAMLLRGDLELEFARIKRGFVHGNSYHLPIYSLDLLPPGSSSSGVSLSDHVTDKVLISNPGWILEFSCIVTSSVIGIKVGTDYQLPLCYNIATSQH